MQPQSFRCQNKFIEYQHLQCTFPKAFKKNEGKNWKCFVKYGFTAIKRWMDHKRNYFLSSFYRRIAFNKKFSYLKLRFSILWIFQYCDSWTKMCFLCLSNTDYTFLRIPDVPKKLSCEWYFSAIKQFSTNFPPVSKSIKTLVIARMTKWNFFSQQKKYHKNTYICWKLSIYVKMPFRKWMAKLSLLKTSNNDNS